MTDHPGLVLAYTLYHKTKFFRHGHKTLDLTGRAARIDAELRTSPAEICYRRRGNTHGRLIILPAAEPP